MDLSYFIQLLAQFLAVVVVLSLHEWAHAYIAYVCGDPTAKYAGRMTLNPAKHFDLVGLLAFTFAGFGWAKPVPINPNNFKKRTWGVFATSIAGIAVNLLFAFLIYPVAQLIFAYVFPFVSGKYLGVLLVAFFTSIFGYSLNFAAFNLIPLFPLDGFRVVTAFNKKRGKVYTFFEKYGQYILLGLILISMLSRYLPILGYIDLLGLVMGWLTDAFYTPIAAFWGLILTF